MFAHHIHIHWRLQSTLDKDLEYLCRFQLMRCMKLSNRTLLRNNHHWKHKELVEGQLVEGQLVGGQLGMILQPLHSLLKRVHYMGFHMYSLHSYILVGKHQYKPEDVEYMFQLSHMYPSDKIHYWHIGYWRYM